MNTLILNQPKPMKEHILPNIIFILSSTFNVGVWVSNFSTGYKIALGILSGATAIMAFMNNYKAWVKNYKTYWIVVKIEYVVNRFSPKKARHRKNSISHKKNESDA